MSMSEATHPGSPLPGEEIRRRAEAPGGRRQNLNPGDCPGAKRVRFADAPKEPLP